jgi:uncharacterized protein (TIGR02117 family)
VAEPLNPPDPSTIFVVVRGWHTDLALSVDDLRGPLTGFREVFPGARYLVFGFGERTYVQAREKSMFAMLAALAPGPGLMLVTGLTVPPAKAFGAADVTPLRLSQPGMAALNAFISDALADGKLERVGRGPYDGSLFYAASGTYSLAYTCNTWTADGLQASGLPVRADGVLFAGQVQAHAHQAAAYQK